mgnify:CR=1 FL=1
MIEEKLKAELLRRVENSVKDIEPDWTVEFIEDRNEFLVHTHSTEALMYSDKFTIVIDNEDINGKEDDDIDSIFIGNEDTKCIEDEDIKWFVFELLLDKIHIGDGELVFVYHIYKR